MRITLNTQEIKRAVQVYIAAKTGTNARDCDVRLYPRAREGLYATVDVLRSARIPTLRDEVQNKE
jgi:hypothetical protein